MKVEIKILITVLVLNAHLSFTQTTRSAEEAQGLKIGVKAPDFTAIDATGNKHNLNSLLENGSVVLIFYRGFWCPYCNKHLQTVQDSLQLIREKGATVIAVTPEKPEYLDKMADKSGAKFTLLYDEGYKIANAYDVSFTPPKATLVKYNTFLGANLKESHSDDSQKLPIPATYVIDQNGIIIWRHFDPNYRKRSSVNDILNVLP